MRPLQASIEWCLRHSSRILLEEALVIFIPLDPVYDTGFKLRLMFL